MNIQRYQSRQRKLYHCQRFASVITLKHVKHRSIVYCSWLLSDGWIEECRHFSCDAKAKEENKKYCQYWMWAALQPINTTIIYSIKQSAQKSGEMWRIYRILYISRRWFLAYSMRNVESDSLNVGSRSAHA